VRTRSLPVVGRARRAGAVAPLDGCNLTPSREDLAPLSRGLMHLHNATVALHSPRRGTHTFAPSMACRLVLSHRAHAGTLRASVSVAFQLLHLGLVKAGWHYSYSRSSAPLPFLRFVYHKAGSSKTFTTFITPLCSWLLHFACILLHHTAHTHAPQHKTFLLIHSTC